jgi:hypothetical protein
MPELCIRVKSCGDTSEYTGLRLTVLKVHTGGKIFLSFQNPVKHF